MKRISVAILALLTLTIFSFTGCVENEPNNCDKKPVIYLYPKEDTEVSVKLDYDGELTCTYPLYKDGWNVLAQPNGTLLDIKDNRQYSYLYWEGVTDFQWEFNQGFVVEGAKTVEFLQEKLAYLGLEPKEYNEFIVYWLPQMQENKYNLIYFAGDDYDEQAKLSIDPKPDSMLRVFMVFKPLEKPILIDEQKLESFDRKGFTVVEWGGTEIK